ARVGDASQPRIGLRQSVLTHAERHAPKIGSVSNIAMATRKSVSPESEVNPPAANAPQIVAAIGPSHVKGRAGRNSSATRRPTAGRTIGESIGGECSMRGIFKQ